MKRLRSIRATLTRPICESELVYLREFVASDAAPTPAGFNVTCHEPPMAIDVIRERFSPEARPFIILSALRSDCLNIQEEDLITRFNEVLRQICAPRPVDEPVETPTTCPPDSQTTFISSNSELAPSASSSFDREIIRTNCLQPGQLYRDCIHTFRSGNPQASMVGRLKRAISIDKVEILMSTVAESTRVRYKAGWLVWHDFRTCLEIPPR